jgi:uncharacterized protein
MIVLLEEIGEDGLTLEQVLEESFLGKVLEGDGTGYKPAGAGALKARFDRVGDKLLLKGDGSLRVLGECRRCLAAVELDVPVHFDLNLVQRPPGGEDDEPEKPKEKKPRRGEGQKTASFELEAADEALFDGREIDLDAIVREQILLDLPMDGLCREDCRGLCSVCGQDLNVRECGCERKVVDPRWAALKDIKL